MKKQIRHRIEQVRALLRQEGLDAYYYSGTDPHHSEYLCDHWQVRRFLTGFTGSSGEVVITDKEAGLWTDSRYFIQAEIQLEGTGIQLFRLRVPGEVSVSTWLCHSLPKGGRVGVDSGSLPYEVFRMMSEQLGKNNISLISSPSILPLVWKERPALPRNPIFGLDSNVTGETCRSKLRRISEVVHGKGASLTLITALDDLAWTFNLRGSDVPFNPVFMGYAVVGTGYSHLFLHDDMLPAILKDQLQNEGVTVGSYSGFVSFISEIRDQTIYLDPAGTPAEIYTLLSRQCRIVEGIAVASALKAVKNETELYGFRKAMRSDGAAMVAFMAWLHENRNRKDWTEYTVKKKISELRATRKHYMGDSFEPIVGYRDHGAIVHLTVDAQSANQLSDEGVLLIDSGGHYLHGTTDITRTFALGRVTEQQKTDYTLVLKGLIALSSVAFPEGTRGIHLDIMARLPLWKNGLNYGHGTGHGVGHFLNVHEGPGSIRREWNSCVIAPGMIFTNEPGIYRENEYGIRLENMMVCVEKQNTPFGKFFGFETLTLCPFDLSLINPELLSPEETDWLNEYHGRVRKTLSPMVLSNHVQFLEELTREIT